MCPYSRTEMLIVCDLSLTDPCRLMVVLDICRVIELLDRLQRTGELPPPKLQALQRVLQSKFCAAIREVSTMLRRGRG